MMDHYPHLVPFEPAARVYCKSIEVDPDAVYHSLHPLGVTLIRPEWHKHAEALIELSRMLNALREAASQGH